MLCCAVTCGCNVGVPFPAGDAGRSQWDKWALAAGTALRRCHECGGGKNEDFSVFASRSIAPSQYEMVRIPVTCEGSKPEEYVVRSHDGKTAGPARAGMELFVVEIRVQAAADWDRALVGPCTMWLIKRRHRSAAGEHCEYLRYMRMDKQTVVEATLSLEEACALCAVSIRTHTAKPARRTRTILEIGDTVHARFTEDSTRWKPARVVAKQPETDSFVLHFDGYADEVAGVPRARIRPTANTGVGSRCVTTDGRTGARGGVGLDLEPKSTAGTVVTRSDAATTTRQHSHGVPGPRGRLCAGCSETKYRADYSTNQWTRKEEGFSRCKVCCTKEQERRLKHTVISNDGPGGSMSMAPQRTCSTCVPPTEKPKGDFSGNQWSKGAQARCKECLAVINGRVCTMCVTQKGRSSYSLSQWRKGVGFSRCEACVGEALRPPKKVTAHHQAPTAGGGSY